jgi:hypothetical protein
MLNWNKRMVQNLSPLEIGMFIVGRVLLGFGVGAWVMYLFPALALSLIFPPIILGILLSACAAKGLLEIQIQIRHSFSSSPIPLIP